MNSNSIALEEIEKMRDHLFLAESTYPHLKKLMKLREELEKNTQKIHKQISQKLYLNPISETHQLKLDLKQLNQEIATIDYKLDEWEDLDQKTLQCMRKNLFHSIWERFPNQFESEKQLWQKFSSASSIKTKVLQTQNFLQEIIEIMQVIKNARSKVKNKGIFSYIFGVSPNIIIERNLLHMHDLINLNQESIKEICQLEERKHFIQVFQRIFQTISQLSQECKKTWGFSHIDTTIMNCNKEILDHAEELKKLASENNCQINLLEKQLNEWLNDVNLGNVIN